MALINLERPRQPHLVSGPLKASQNDSNSTFTATRLEAANAVKRPWHCHINDPWAFE